MFVHFCKIFCVLYMLELLNHQSIDISGALLPSRIIQHEAVPTLTCLIMNEINKERSLLDFGKINCKNRSDFTSDRQILDVFLGVIFQQ